MNKIVNYDDLDINSLELHPLHKQTFIAPSDKKEAMEWLKRSFDRYGKLKDIYIVQPFIDGAIKHYIIDGAKTWEILKAQGEKRVRVAILNLTDERDILQVMVELQKSHHGSIEEEYKIYESLYSVFSKGSGYRTDLVELEDKDAEEEGIDMDEKKKRRETVYDVIGKMSGINKNRVMYILKIGRVNPWHFERIAKERYAIYAAYLDCIAEEKGEEPPVPPAKMPVYESDATTVPAYDGTTATPHDGFTDGNDGNNSNSAQEGPTDCNATDNNDLQDEDATDANDDGFINITFKVSREQLKGVDTTTEPEVTIDSSNSQYVIVNLKFNKNN